MTEETQNPEISPAAEPAPATAEGTNDGAASTSEISEDAVTLVGGQTAPAASEAAITSVGAHLAATTVSAAGDVPAADGDATVSNVPAADGDATVSNDAASAVATEGPEGDAKKKKKRRRKKKKKPTEGGGGDARPPQAFTRMFGKNAGRQSPFKSGEIVAGIVRSTDTGTITLDLFGRAMAFVDAREAHAIEPLPEPPPKPEKKAPEAKAVPEAAAPEAAADAVEAAAEAPAAADAPAADAPAADAPAADAPAADAPADAPVVDAPAIEAAPEVAAKSVEGAVDAESSEDDPGDDESPEEVAASAEPTKGRPQIEPADLTQSWPEPELPAIGSVFRGRIGSVAESGDMALVNRAVDRPATKAGIRLARDEQRRVEGVIFGYNRGGFDVLVSGVRCFCPARSISLTPIDNPRSLLGKKLEFSVPPSRGGKSIIVSRRGILERELRKASREYMKSLVIGTKLEGAVTQVRDYGLLVDIGGGVEGLVHQSEVSWNRGDRPSDAAKPGDKVMVEILKVTAASRKDRYGKVSLSMKSCLPDPWNDAVENLQKGVPMKGKVVRTTEFGAFIELAPAVEGLLHISELGRDVKHAKDVLKEGEEIDIIIERMDKKARRLSLSRLSAADLKAIAAGELDLTKAPKSTKPGSHIKVKITRVEHHGLFAQVEGVVGKRGRGYINNRDLPEKIDKKNRLGQGSIVDVRIVGTDRDGSLKLSIKGFLQDEERSAVKAYRKESSKEGGFGTFGDLLKAKLKTD